MEKLRQQRQCDQVTLHFEAADQQSDEAAVGCQGHGIDVARWLAVASSMGEVELGAPGARQGFFKLGGAAIAKASATRRRSAVPLGKVQAGDAGASFHELKLSAARICVTATRKVVYGPLPFSALEVAVNFAKWLRAERPLDARPLPLGGKPIVGMIHLGALPGAPLAPRAASPATIVAAVEERALGDAAALVAGGVDGLMLENFGDAPFFPGQVPTITIAAMTRIALAIRQAHPTCPLGVNVLRNDGGSALAIAAAIGASFIRVNVLTGARVTDQGVIQGIAHELLRLRRDLGAEDVRILADVDVKHSAPLGARPVADEVKDLIGRGLADGVIVSGRGTGAAVDRDTLAAVAAVARGTPVWLGSGVTTANVRELASLADAFIVGTALKVASDPAGPVDPEKVRQLIAARG